MGNVGSTVMMALQKRKVKITVYEGNRSPTGGILSFSTGGFLPCPSSTVQEWEIAGISSQLTNVIVEMNLTYMEEFIYTLPSTKVCERAFS